MGWVRVGENRQFVLSSSPDSARFLGGVRGRSRGSTRRVSTYNEVIISRLRTSYTENAATLSARGIMRVVQGVLLTGYS